LSVALAARLLVNVEAFEKSRFKLDASFARRFQFFFREQSHGKADRNGPPLVTRLSRDAVGQKRRENIGRNRARPCKIVPGFHREIKVCS